MPITDLLERNARIYPEDVALVEINPSNQPAKDTTWREFSLIETAHASKKYRRQMTWKEFDVKANRFANLLMTREVKRGDKVAILLMNCLEWLPIYFGILKTGAIAVPMNFRYAADEIHYCAELADVRMLVFGPEFIDRVNAVKHKLVDIDAYFFVGTEEETPEYALNYDYVTRFCSTQVPPIAISDDDLAAIYFSSGTTGFPKAILHAHRALISSAMTEQNHHGQQKDDVFLCIPPLYHTGAKMHWFGSLYSGSKAVLLRGVSPEWVLQTASDEGATIVWLLVPWAQDILDAIDSGKVDLKDYDLSKWRLMHIGAQPVPQSLIKRWKQIFPAHAYDTNYGLSESIGPGCVHLGVENIDHVGAIGKAGYLWETKIVDENGEEVKQGEVGELAVKGPGVMLEYYKDPRATEEAIVGDWLMTGDMAMEDEEGFIYLVDRKKDVIISGGENLYPVQIEDFLRSNKKIRDAAVIGLPDPRLGEIAAAIVELRENETMTEEELNQFCQDLPRYKRPRKIIFADVPRNATGKIEKPKLREIYGADKLVAAQFNS
ncbi:MAG: AMP-binding protein [Lachnospiraceae bacterium]|nr:AMP-binding protein [Lachnospiraceae bacterium]